MRKAFVAAALVAILATGTSFGEERDQGASRAGLQEQIAPGWIERGFARLERAIERLETKLSGHERGGMMQGCQGVMGGGMMGGGMMGGGSRPNDRWRQPEDKR